jgi:hypothetical protein
MTKPIPKGFLQPLRSAVSAAGIRGIGPQADFFTLSGEQSPGLATLESVNAAQGWDIRKGMGLDFATVVPAGEELSKIVFKIDLWTTQDSQDFDAYAAKYLSRAAPAPPGLATPKALGFTHDQASAPPYNVSAVVILDVAYLGQTEAGMVSHRVSFLEWRPPKPAGKRMDQSTPPTDTGMPAATDVIGQQQNAATNELNAQEAINAGIQW